MLRCTGLSLHPGPFNEQSGNGSVLCVYMSIYVHIHTDAYTLAFIFVHILKFILYSTYISFLHTEIHEFTPTPQIPIHSTRFILAFLFSVSVTFLSDNKSGSHYRQHICSLASLGFLAQNCLMAFLLNYFKRKKWIKQARKDGWQCHISEIW